MNKQATVQLPHSFRHIRLELARSKDFPRGSTAHGYEFVAPLDGKAHLDPALWSKHRSRCLVRRFWGEAEESGHLVHKPGGAEHALWAFDYSAAAPHGEETGYRFGAHAFRAGEYVSIGDDAGETHTFRVVAVAPLP